MHLPWLPTALRPMFSAQPACPPLWPPPSLAGPAQVLQGWSQPDPGRKRLEAETVGGGTIAQRKRPRLVYELGERSGRQQAAFPDPGCTGKGPPGEGAWRRDNCRGGACCLATGLRRSARVRGCYSASTAGGVGVQRSQETWDLPGNSK